MVLCDLYREHVLPSRDQITMFHDFNKASDFNKDITDYLNDNLELFGNTSLK